jgi:hypothetical protein
MDDLQSSVWRRHRDMLPLVVIVIMIIIVLALMGII